MLSFLIGSKLQCPGAGFSKVKSGSKRSGFCNPIFYDRDYFYLDRFDQKNVTVGLLLSRLQIITITKLLFFFKRISITKLRFEKPAPADHGSHTHKKIDFS